MTASRSKLVPGAIRKLVCGEQKKRSARAISRFFAAGCTDLVRLSAEYAKSFT